MSDFELLNKDKDYLDMLIETKVITHVGSGPVDPAPKEKETKSPVEDGTGQGTKQASTGHPNVIPPIAYLKKELAKEGIELGDEQLQKIARTIFEDVEETSEGLSKKAIKSQAMLAARKRFAKTAGWDKERTQQAIDLARKMPWHSKSQAQKRKLENALEMCGSDHGDDEEKVTKKKVSKEDISHALGSFSVEVREAELSGQANAAAKDAGDSSFDMEDLGGGDDDKGDEGEGSAVGEQMMAARGSTADKIAARQSGAVSRPVAGSPADRAAKASAFEKQKAAWNQSAASTAAQPEQVQKTRQPVPTAPATRPLTPGGMLPKPTPGTRPLTPGGMLPKPTQGKRSLRTRI